MEFTICASNARFNMQFVFILTDTNPKTNIDQSLLIYVLEIIVKSTSWK